MINRFFLKLAIAGLGVVCVFSGDLSAEELPGEGFHSFVKPSATVQDILQSPKNRPKADTYYLVALEYARKGQTKNALQMIETGLGIEPQNLKLLNVRAAIWARSGRLQNAIQEFQKVLQLDPNDAYARESLRTLVPPQPLPTLKVAAPIISQKPRSPSGTVASGTSAASASATKKLDPSYFELIQYKQRCFYDMSALKRAQESYEKAKPDAQGKFDLDALVSGKYLAAAPLCPQGGTFTWKGTAPECSKHGSFPALESEVSTIFADFNVAMKAKFSRNFPEAKTGFKRVILMYPKWSEAHYQLGDTCFRLGEDQEAIKSTRACLDLDGKNNDAKLLLANLYFKTGQKDSAVRLLEQVLKHSSGTIYAVSARGIINAIRSGKNYYQIFPPD